MKKLQYRVEGMSCEHCVRAVDRTLRAVKGVQALAVKVGNVELEVDDAVTFDTLNNALQDEGYQLLQ